LTEELSWPTITWVEDWRSYLNSYGKDLLTSNDRARFINELGIPPKRADDCLATMEGHMDDPFNLKDMLNILLVNT
jgi:hypothetical protein